MSIKPVDLTVENKEGKRFQGSEVFKDKKVMIYFSAHWCPPCRTFTPVLAEFYASVKESGEPVEAVFVSCDRDEAGMKSYFKESHGDYYVVPYDAPEREGLMKQHGVSGIPYLVVVDDQGNVITKDGRSDVQSKGPACVKNWK